MHIYNNFSWIVSKKQQTIFLIKQFYFIFSLPFHNTKIRYWSCVCVNMLSFCVTRSCLPVVPSSNRTKMRNIKLFGLWIKQKLLLPHIQNQPTNQPHNHHHLPPPLLLLKSSSTTAVVLPNKNTQSCLWWWSISLWLIDWLNDGCISMHILNVVCLLLLPMSKWNRKLYDMIWWWFSIHPCYRCYLSIKSWCCYVFLKKNNF